MGEALCASCVARTYRLFASLCLCGRLLHDLLCSIDNQAEAATADTMTDAETGKPSTAKALWSFA